MRLQAPAPHKSKTSLHRNYCKFKSASHHITLPVRFKFKWVWGLEGLRCEVYPCAPPTFPSSCCAASVYSETAAFWVSAAVSAFYSILFFPWNLSNRRFLEEEMGVASSSSTTSELCVMYRQNHSSRPGRKVFGSSPSRETGYLCGQVARVRLTTVERKEGQQSQ